MGTRQRFVIPLAEVTDGDEPLVGGKAGRLAALARAGFAVPGGFCVTVIPSMMTHLVPLACAVVERRGGMLIHGAIIARELGIPCVNGVAGVIEMLHDGDIVTVDGYLGIVTLGTPDFDLELADVSGGAGLRPPGGGA